MAQTLRQRYQKLVEDEIVRTVSKMKHFDAGDWEWLDAPHELKSLFDSPQAVKVGNMAFEIHMSIPGFVFIRRVVVSDFRFSRDKVFHDADEYRDV